MTHRQQSLGGRSEAGQFDRDFDEHFRHARTLGRSETVAAMLDRRVHHAEMISLKGDSYRMRGRDFGRVPTANTLE
ncbi:ATP-binding protein [Streptomyces sp. NPDC002896]|uniref:ATP-binding protein n=1 Tax=Streptomyces sp. NPDC002896 TaxID=3154438 RepID=UPI00332166E0